MKKIAFVGNSEPPKRLLEIFRKFTPNKSGIWGQLQGVDNYKDADYFGVIDWLPSEIRNQVDENKCIFLGAHPETMHAYKDMSNYKGLKMYDCKNSFGFGEWWIKYDYDYLINLQPIQKTKSLTSIVSDANSQEYHRKRREYLERFCNKYSSKIDLYGRIKPWGSLINCYKGACGSLDPRGSAATGGQNDHMSGKENVYETYNFAIEFDATGKHYFSERVFDCLLLWCMPIYWGGENLHLYIPKESFMYLDINGDGSDFINKLDKNLYEKSLPYIAEARNLLLNKYHIWARCHEAIFGVSK